MFGENMPKTIDDRNNKIPLNFMDALPYMLAASSMAIISISFLLWLQF